MKTFSTLLLATLLLSACNDSSAPLNSLEEEAEAQALADKLFAQQELAKLEPTDEDGDGYKTFADTEYGISFDFPSDWIFEISGNGEAYRVDLSNEAREDYCKDSTSHLVFTVPNQKDASLSFEDFVKSPEMYDQNGGLGQLGGALTETTLAGHAAFQAESTGYESMCEDEAYVVEMDASTYLFIGLFTGTVDNEATEVQKILDSLKID